MLFILTLITCAEVIHSKTELSRKAIITWTQRTDRAVGGSGPQYIATTRKLHGAGRSCPPNEIPAQNMKVSWTSHGQSRCPMSRSWLGLTTLGANYLLGIFCHKLTSSTCKFWSFLPIIYRKMQQMNNMKGHRNKSKNFKDNLSPFLYRIHDTPTYTMAFTINVDFL